MVYLGKPSPQNISFCLEKVQKGGWRVISESKLFEELFAVVFAWKFLTQGGGGFSPKSKLFGKLFCLSLDFFLRGGGGDKI